MSAQPPEPQIPPQLAAFFAQAPAQQQAQPAPEQQQPGPTPEQIAEQELEKLLGGELPGAGYLFPDDPQKRQANLVKTTADVTRDALLRAVEVCAQEALMPYGAVAKSEAAKAALAYAQAFLLLDPTVDENGVPVGAQAVAQGQAQEGAALAQGAAQQGVNEHKHTLEMAAEAHKAQHPELHPDPEHFTQKPGEPPRVAPNAAEEEIELEHKPESEKLKGARGDRPLPKPRPGD